MSEASSNGALGWLDTLTNNIGAVAGKAVDVVGQVAQASAAAKAQTDQANAKPVASAQVALSGSGSTLLWVGVGLVVIIGAVVLLRRR